MTQDKEYTVHWVIDLDAANPREAAITALDVQRCHDSTAMVFQVFHEGELVEVVDLGLDTEEEVP